MGCDGVAKMGCSGGCLGAWVQGADRRWAGATRVARVDCYSFYPRRSVDTRLLRPSPVK